MNVEWFLEEARQQVRQNLPAAAVTSPLFCPVRYTHEMIRISISAQHRPFQRASRAITFVSEFSKSSQLELNSLNFLNYSVLHLYDLSDSRHHWTTRMLCSLLFLGKALV